MEEYPERVPKRVFDNTAPGSERVRVDLSKIDPSKIDDFRDMIKQEEERKEKRRIKREEEEKREEEKKREEKLQLGMWRSLWHDCIRAIRVWVDYFRNRK